MIGGAVLLVLLSAVFFVLWQYFESPWLILGYIIAILAVCVAAFLCERRKYQRIFDRFERILGGALSGRAGGQEEDAVEEEAKAIKGKISDIIKEIKVITPELNIVTIPKNELNYSYRNSFLKENKDYICIETTLEMSFEEPYKIKEIMDNRRQRRIDTQPLDMPTAGSVFRNPEGLAAGKLIEDIGLKGYSIGGAMISPKHANFIVNTGNATYEDIIELIKYTQNKVEEHYGIKLLLEQEIIG